MRDGNGERLGRLGRLGRRAVLVLAALVALGGPGLGAVRPAAAETDVGAVLAEVDAYWSAVFAANGLGYSSPNVAPVIDETLTACGPLDPSFGPAGYCPFDRTIYISPSWFGPDTPDAVWYVAVAHEWGHHIEKLLGYPDEPSVESEQRTDCMAGAFIGTAVAAGVVPQGTVNRALYFVLLIGDPPFIGRENFTHGNAGDRAERFNRGLWNGVSGCEVGLG